MGEPGSVLNREEAFAIARTAERALKKGDYQAAAMMFKRAWRWAVGSRQRRGRTQKAGNDEG